MMEPSSHVHNPRDELADELGQGRAHERQPVLEPGGAAVELHVEPHGPDHTLLGGLLSAVLTHPSLASHLEGTEHRLLSLRVADESESKRRTACIPERFVASVYDYTNNRVLEVSGALAHLDPAAPEAVEVRVLGHQPLPSDDEFAAAVDIVRHDRELRARIDSGQLQPYRPMPPLIAREGPEGRVERTLTIGLRTTAES